MDNKRDQGEPYFLVKRNSPLQVFKYVHVYAHCSTNHGTTIGLKRSSSSTTRGKDVCPLIKRALEGLKRSSSVGVRKGKIFWNKWS